MKKNIYKFFIQTNSILILSGVTYYIFKNFIKAQTEFGPVPSPVTKYLQYSHIIIGPIVIFAVGRLWDMHAKPMNKNGKQKKVSGKVMFYAFGLLALSGYLTQMSIVDNIHEVVEYTHLGLALIWSLAFFSHAFVKR